MTTRGRNAQPGDSEAGPPRIVLAAGVVLWRPNGHGVELGLVHRPKYDDWSLPKGKLDPGEHLLACAVREVVEETGHAVVLGRPLGIVNYSVSGAQKQVHYWTARADDDAGEWPGTTEIDRFEFLPVERALHRLTQPHDAALAVEAVTGLGEPPQSSSPLIVLRHGKALSRGGWSGPDAARPLDPRGVGQADRLALLLGCYGIQRIVSSPALRCTDTVKPYATTARRPIENDPRVSEDVFESDPAQAGKALVDLVSEPAPTVVCTHRPVLPSLLEPLMGAGKPDPALRPGDFVVLHRQRGELVAVERHSA